MDRGSSRSWSKVLPLPNGPLRIRAVIRKIGPCTGISVPDAATATTSDAAKQAQVLSPCSSDSDCGNPFLTCVARRE